MKKPRTHGLTLTEVLVAFALITTLTAAAISQLPRLSAKPSLDQDAQRLASSLEAAHTQAVGSRHNVTLTGQGEQLTITSSDGLDTQQYQGGDLAGSLQIQPDGTTSGRLTVQNDGACTALTLNPGGLGQQQSCDTATTASNPEYPSDSASTGAADSGGVIVSEPSTSNPDPATDQPGTALEPTQPGPISGITNPGPITVQPDPTWSDR